MAFFICPPKFQLMGTSVECTLTCFELVIKFVLVLLDMFQLVDAIETGLIWSLFPHFLIYTCGEVAVF